MPDLKRILITGGTSGLGGELVKNFHRRGFHVVTTGRREAPDFGFSERFSYYRVDFSNLEMTASVFLEIAALHQFDIVINNAGILSPPDYTVTRNGHEYTFQVNFLAHMLADIILLKAIPAEKPLIMASITSPVYKLAKIDINTKRQYNAMQAYSDSKLYQAILCPYLSDSFKGMNLTCCSFNPGVFGSGIYRMRGPVFRLLYRIAAPFMRSPERVAGVLSDILTGKEIEPGVIYNIRKVTNKIPQPDPAVSDNFWSECHKFIEPYIT